MPPKKGTKKIMQKKKVALETLIPENYPNIYANNANMVIGINDLAIDFGYKRDVPEADKAIVEMRTRIVMSPSHAKIFVKKMQGLLEAYEEQFGTIPVEPHDK